jgi:hypothetical protein
VPEALRQALLQVKSLATHRGVGLAASPTDARCQAPPSLFAAQLELLLRHALQATAAGGQVNVHTVPSGAEMRIEIEHGGELAHGGLKVQFAPAQSPEATAPSLALLAAATLAPLESGSGTVRTAPRPGGFATTLCYPIAGSVG